MNNQEEFIRQFQQANQAFRTILDKDRQHYIIPPEQYTKIERMQLRNEELLKKLQDRDFTVAIVGLEKAGKSTLGNALIKIDALPAYTERCTFTTTEVRAGSEDKAEIEFYSVAEFAENFRKMLAQMGFPGEADYATFNKEVFDRFWNSVGDDESKQAFFNLHDSTTVRDIREMLDERRTIQALLGQPVMTFTGKEQLESPAFQKYITGYARKEKVEGGAEVVIRTGEPYAVKKVTIYAKGLGDMQNIRLFDVPGFDSPTRLHKEQTKQKLMEADAIILVTDVGTRPNLVGTQVEMLNKGLIDEDGIKLSDKAFVFGNRLDVAGSEQNQKNNAAALRSDALKFKIAQPARILSGSAWLCRKQQKNEPIDGNPLGGKFGVEELRQGLRQYYDTDRAEVLERRARQRIKEVRDILQQVLDESSGASEGAGIARSYFQISSILKNAFVPFREAVHNLAEDYLEDIRTNHPFSTDLKDDIEHLFPSVDDETVQGLLERAKNQQKLSASRNFPLQYVDTDWRETVRDEFRNRLVGKIVTMTAEREKDLWEKIEDKLLELMQIPSPTDEQRAAIRELFDAAIPKDGATCNFTPLVDRFAMKPLEVIIYDPFAGSQRKEFLKEKANLAEMNVLSTYYLLGRDDTDDFDGATERAGLFPMILAHVGIPGGDDAKEVQDEETTWRTSPAGKWLQEFFSENKDQLRKGLSLTIDLLPIGKWAKLLSRAALTEERQRRLENELERVLYGSAAKKDLSALQAVMESSSKAAAAGEEKEDRATMLDKLAAHAQVTTKEEMIAALDDDVRILRSVMRFAVIEAMGLDTAFIVTVSRNIDAIRDLYKRTDLVDAWIEKYAMVLRPEAVAKAHEQAAQEEISRSISEEIRRVLEQEVL